MKRVAVFVVLLVGCAALYLLQRSHVEAPITPRPLLYLLADTQREAERIPLLLTRVSNREEVQIGEQLALQSGLASESTSDSDASAISAYLNSVGNRVAKNVRRQNIPYRFYYTNSGNLVNAYALPGGHVVVGRGLLELLESEDELAVVLGHEIAHVDNRHAIEHLQFQMASRKFGLGEVYRTGRPAIDLFEAGYTKDQELEADRVGLDLAVSAGYSAAGGLSLMKRFQRLEPAVVRRAQSPLEEFAQVPFAALSEYFRSHPPSAERRTALEVEIDARAFDVSRAARPLVMYDLLHPAKR